MLLPSIFITVVVCTVEICEFLSAFPLFICPSQPLDNLSPVSRDTCDNCSHYTPRKLCLWEGILFSRCPSDRPNVCP